MPGWLEVWDPRDTQFCVGCQLYHYRDDCTDPYFNAPENWKDAK